MKNVSAYLLMSGGVAAVLGLEVANVAIAAQLPAKSGVLDEPVLVVAPRGPVGPKLLWPPLVVPSLDQRRHHCRCWPQGPARLTFAKVVLGFCSIPVRLSYFV